MSSHWIMDVEIFLIIGLIVGMVASRFFGATRKHDLRGGILLVSLILASLFGVIFQQLALPRFFTILGSFAATVAVIGIFVRRYRHDEQPDSQKRTRAK